MTGRRKQSKDKVLLKASLINIFIDIETMHTLIFFFFPGLTKARLKKMRLVFSFLRVVPSDKCYICTWLFFLCRLTIYPRKKAPQSLFLKIALFCSVQKLVHSRIHGNYFSKSCHHHFAKILHVFCYFQKEKIK